jgi:hypothetical protein
VCDKIVPAYAQHAHAIIFENYSKIPRKKQILTIKNQNFEKPFRNPSNRTQVTILKKRIVGYFSKKFGSAHAHSPRKCLNFKILAKNEGKEAKFFFFYLLRSYKDLI